MSRVEIWRGGAVESTHRLSVAVVDAGGRLRASTGSPQLVTFARSAIKPLQALPLIEDGVVGRFGFGQDTIALACASHSGEDHHVAVARRMLRSIGVDESMLACGPHAPFHEPTARRMAAAGMKPGRVHNNCSGKHAGMLALATVHGWPVGGYEKAEHPVQRRMLATTSEWAGVAEDDMVLAVDGCGVTTFGLPLDRMAAAFARLARGARQGDAAPAAVLGAMAKHPEYVAGTGRLCTALMRAVDGRIVAKTGAEGVYCAAVPGAELGIALKVEDGAKRAAEPALLAVLGVLGLVSDDEMAQLGEFATPAIMNTRGERVGAIRALVELEACA